MTEQQGAGATLRLYNSLSREVEDFEPRPGEPVSFYSCGPTVYNHVHIGNLRAFVFYDLVRRTLEYFGHEVRHVMNITDVDDKTIRKSREEGVSLKEVTERYTESFLSDLAALGVKPADSLPRATDYIAEMVSFVGRLQEKGLAYKGEDGSTWFPVGRYEPYGKLIELDRASLKAGAGGRVASDEYDKEDVADFALWKARVEADGDVYWPSELGEGRPGWHLECSVMAIRELGETIDIHAGGIDLKFPHHENEIAQAEGATGKPFVRFFVHNAHLLVAGEKMSKSKGNFYTRRQLEEQAGATGRELRFCYIRSHYRKSMNFQVTYDGDRPVRFDSLEDARAALAGYDEFVAELRSARDRGDEGAVRDSLGSALEAAAASFDRALAEDMNVSGALAAVFELMTAVRKLGSLSGSEAEAALAWLARIDGVLGILPAEAGLPEELAGLLEERLAARAAKDWARSDEIRDLFKERGWLLKDTADGQVWRRL